jgi:L-lactate permease
MIFFPCSSNWKGIFSFVATFDTLKLAVSILVPMANKDGQGMDITSSVLGVFSLFSTVIVTKDWVYALGRRSMKRKMERTYKRFMMRVLTIIFLVSMARVAP